MKRCCFYLKKNETFINVRNHRCFLFELHSIFIVDPVVFLNIYLHRNPALKFVCEFQIYISIYFNVAKIDNEQCNDVMQCRVQKIEHSKESCDFSSKYYIVSVKFLVFIFCPWGNLQRKWKVTKENK